MFINQSTEINEVLAALVKAKSHIGSITRGAHNPFHKSSYADLSSILNEIEPHLQKEGIAVLQPVHENHIVTTFVHTSGQYVSVMGTELVAAKQNDPQAMGSAITYARRYSLSAALSLNAEKDDDGEKAMNRKPSKPSKLSLRVDDENWAKVINALQNGFTFKQIEAKYHIAPEVKNQLLKSLNID